MSSNYFAANPQLSHLVRDQGVGGSNPLSPTNVFNKLKALFRFDEFPQCRFRDCESLIDPQPQAPTDVQQATRSIRPKIAHDEKWRASSLSNSAAPDWLREFAHLRPTGSGYNVAIRPLTNRRHAGGHLRPLNIDFRI